ncbi:MAG: O-antigen ligase family protein [Candidatus Omnitrophica bacterium]|nr:O-antigen ligase family protein [Candidatus Omnitrophota bacterium]
MFNAVLLYLIIFYIQPGSRIRSLGTLRIELVIGGLLLLILFAQRGTKIFRKTKLNKAIALFFVSVCLSMGGALWTHTASHSIEVFIGMLKFFSIYIMIVATVDSEKKLKKFMIVYLGCIFILFTEPFLLSLQGMNFEYKQGVSHLFGVGQFAHYNSLGGITASNLSFMIQWFLFTKNILFKILLLLFSAIGIRVIILTGSRTAYVGALVLALLAIFFGKYRIRNLIIVSVLGIIIYSFMPDQYRDRFISIKQSVDVVEGEKINDSMYTRWQIIKDAWGVFLKYPIVGCGLDSFYQLRGKIYGRWQQSHNLYLQILTNLGIFGMVAFLYLLRTLFQYIVYTKNRLIMVGRHKSFTWHVLIGCQMFIIMRLAVGMFGHDLFENYWWLISGIVMACYSIVEKQSADSEERTGLVTE